jgi:eukaryotic-like serine/threonine-protein kinase
MKPKSSSLSSERIATVTQERTLRSQRSALVAAREPSLIGQLLDQRYRVRELIGSGGMSRVYRAEHELLGRTVAIKVLRERLASDSHVASRLVREARALATIDSRHVVRIIDIGRLPHGPLYLVLEDLQGEDLAARVARQGPLPAPLALELALEMCDAASDVHASGIVHRDIKPHNVFITSTGSARVKLLDFGICKVPSYVDDAGSLTLAGSMLGTPHYMAPEQIEGRLLADERTDLYAIGATLYFMLSGQPPFEASSLPRLLVQICECDPPRLMAAGELEQVLRRALAKRAAQRFGDAGELRAALSTCFKTMTRRVRCDRPRRS